MAARTKSTSADTRTQRLLHMPATRILTPLLDGDNPVRPHLQRQLLPEPFDERRSVLVQEPHERDRPLLRVSVGEGERARAGRTDGAASRSAAWRPEWSCPAAFPDPSCMRAQRGTGGAFERRIERRQGLDDPSHPFFDGCRGRRAAPGPLRRGSASSAARSAPIVLRVRAIRTGHRTWRGTASPPSRASVAVARQYISGIGTSKRA